MELAPLGAAPCTRACPAGIQVKRYVGLVAEGRYEEALRVVRQANPLAAISGYLCHRPCEAECACGDTGHPIPIRALKHLAARVVAETGQPPEAPPCPSGRGHVAVLGGGPAGLVAARDLRLLGYAVTIFESSRRLGGLLGSAVPARRLPRWALEADLAYVLAHGVEVRLGEAVQGPLAARKVLAEGFDALLVSTGASRAVCASLPGARGVLAALPLLARLVEGEPPPAFGRALVLGAGQVGVALATELALRGEGRVCLTHSGDVASLPVDPEALRAADRAGVILRCGLGPETAVVEGGSLRGVRFRALASEGREQAGRPRLQAGVAVELEADLVVDASARLPELGGWPAEDVTPWGTLAVRGADLQTAHDRIFAAGEVVSGARSLIDVIAHARRSAALLHRTLSGEVTPPAEPHEGVPRGLRLDLAGVPRQASAWRHVPENPRSARALPLGVDGASDGGSVASVEPFAQAEARRCRRCGPCAECASCSPYCGETVSVDPAGTWVRFPGGAPLPPAVPLTPIRARVDAARCRGCGLCEENCPYAAPRVGLRFVAPGKQALVASVDLQACRGCGLCVGLCPTGALSQGGFENRTLSTRIDALLPGEVP